MTSEESLGFGIWGSGEEARKSWSYIRSDVVVYFCDFLPGQFEGKRLGGIEWISEYQRGEIWLEYHGVFEGQRPTKFNAIVEVVLRPPPGLQIDVGDVCATDW